jgi:hypothetical protein
MVENSSQERLECLLYEGKDYLSKPFETWIINSKFQINVLAYAIFLFQA